MCPGAVHPYESQGSKRTLGSSAPTSFLLVAERLSLSLNLSSKEPGAMGEARLGTRGKGSACLEPMVCAPV